MASIARVQGFRREISQGRARLQIALVVLWIAAQGLAVSNQTSLLAVRGLWAVMPICVAGLAASVGTMVAQRREVSGVRNLLVDVLRVSALPYVLVVVAVLIALGPSFTTDYLVSYLGNPQTWAYLLNLIGVPRYSLPGVFSSNPVPEIVNQNVWIAPCVVLVVLVGSYMPKRRLFQASPLVLALLLGGAALVAQALELDLGDPGGALGLFLRGDGLTGLFAGIFGVLLYRARRRIPSRAIAAAAAVLVLAAIAAAGNEGWKDVPAIRLLIAVPVAYLALVVPQQRWTPSRLVARLVPYLPGLLLFSFPLQQAAVEIGPSEQAALYALAVGGGTALLLAVALWETAGRRIISTADRLALAEAVAWHPAAADRSRRGRVVTVRQIGTWSLVGLIFVALSLGLAWMLYVAFQPDRGGI